MDAQPYSSPAKGSIRAGSCIESHIAFFQYFTMAGTHGQRKLVLLQFVQGSENEAWLCHVIYSSDPGRQITQHLPWNDGQGFSQYLSG